MAIDKTVPNRLQTDIDQRLVRPEAGEMTDAQNVILKEEGANSAGVIKNMLGTTAAPRPTLNPISDNEDVVVIGSVSDTQRGFIYWFVADNNADGVENAIYQQDTSDNSYALVIKNPSLNFDPTGFVKADVINAAFQQDGVVQTALYFTDNRNPPRKINVDRAMNSAVYDATADDFDTVISTCKPAMQRYPTVSFATDQTFEQNNFKVSVFQFAVQQIYIDGEESAVSAYSELAVSNHAIYGAQESEGYGVANHIDNVCQIKIPVDFQRSDLEAIRIIARDGNDGSFFVVDQFDPDVDLYKNFFGEQKQIYDASSRQYKFYNNTLGSYVADTTISKTYDNVPLTAVGQATSGNRLMFSNYEEGRPNTSINATLTVNNKPIYDKNSNYISPGNFSSHVSIGTGLSIDVDALAAALSWSSLESPATTSTVVPAGTVITLGFDFSSIFVLDDINLEFEYNTKTWRNVTSNSEFQSSDEATIRLAGPKQLGDLGGAQSDGDLIPHVFNITLLLEEDTNIGQVMLEIRSRLSSYTAKIKYGASAWNGSTRSRLRFYDDSDPTNPDYLSVDFGSNASYVEVDWGFDDYASGSTSTSFAVKPYIKGFFIGDGNVLYYSHDGNNYVSTGSATVESYGIVGIDMLNEIGEAQSEVTYSEYSANFITSPVFSASTQSYKNGFKAGSSHTFGVVYYDKFNRSGNVNEIGTVYVEDIAARSSNYAQASVTIDLSSTTPPDWATSYQIVYPGPDTIQDFIGYTSGGAYYKKELSGNDHNPDTHTQEIYVSLNSLNIYNEEKLTERRYSFTKGDKLRLVSRFDHAAVTPGRIYDTASDGTAIEFDVVGVTTVDASNLILAHKHGSGGSTVITEEDYGEFLILESSAVNAGALGKDGNDLKFPGYDWFSVTGEDYPDSSSPSVDSRWGQGTVVEVYTPRKTTSERVYFEIGEGAVISNGEHGDPIEATNGNVFFRPVACKTSPDASAVNIYDKNNYEYRTFYLECNSASDRVSGDSWHKGRPHVVFENSATVRRYNGITYSDAYAEDVANLSLSSFNGSLANFFSLESANGACNYIGTLNDQFLIALQENKMSMVPVNKNILQQSQGGDLAALSTRVLNDPRYYTGDYGCGNNPESVLIRDGQVFFVDTSRKKVVRWTSEGLSPISELGVDSLFQTNLDDFTAQGGSRIVSGYDPRYDHYYVTLRPTGAYNGLTLGYGAKGLAQGGAWQSRYTFYPDMYANQDNMMYSAVYRDPVGDDNATIFYSHDNQLRNSFYGDAAQPSIVRVVSNTNPSMTKVFNAVSLEGDSPNWVADPIVTDLNSNAQSLGFVEKEGSYYSFITRDENGTKHITGIGRVASVDSFQSQITFVNKVNRNSIPYGSVIRLVSGGAYTNLGGGDLDVTFVKFIDAYTIEVGGYPTQSGIVDGDLVAISESTINGDPIRGHWAEITLTNNQTDALELFCVNTHIVNSKQNHASGQQ